MPSPFGVRLDDGFSTVITFANATTISFWEKEITPPGMDAGGPVDTTTMRNVLYRTMNAKHLITMTPMTFVAAYNSGVLDDVVNQLGKNQQITVTFPDGRPWTFWGFLDKFQPNALKEGEQPTAQVTIQPTNQNASGTETAPTMGTTSSTGTTTTTTIL